MDLVRHTYDTFKGAEYHLFKMQENLRSPLLNECLSWQYGKPVDEAMKDKLYHYELKYCFHLRGFFWELAAVFDTILQWVNQRYQLGLEEEYLQWNQIEKKTTAGKYQPECDEKYRLIQKVWNSVWYFEVRTYRNFGHRAFNFIQHDISEVEGSEPKNTK